MPPRRAKKAAVAAKSQPKVTARVTAAKASPSATARLSELLVTASAPVPTAAAPPKSKSLSAAGRLATILHGAFLVTMAGRAQIGVTGTALGVSAAVDERWMATLVRYCGFTVVLSDVLECGAAFSDWMHISTAPARQAAAAAAAAAAGGGGGGGASVKLKLLRESVPSVEEAEAFLRRRWGKARAWRATSSRPADPAAESEQSASHSAAPVEPIDEAVKERNEGERQEEEEGEELADSEVYLAQISKELRASLSVEKLRAVVAQMRRDAQGDDKREQEEITRRQQRERLLSTYDLVRTLFSEKRTYFSAEELVQRVSAQNRFGDASDTVWSQLVTLAKHTESGVTILSLDCDGSAAVPVDLSKIDAGALHTLVLRWDRAAASRTRLHEALQLT